jgi:hypothetical protein
MALIRKVNPSLVEFLACVFDSTPEDANEAAPVREMKVLQSECIGTVRCGFTISSKGPCP